MLSSEFLTEEIVSKLLIGNQMLILISKHYLDRLDYREKHVRMSPEEVTPTIKKLVKIKKYINRIPSGQQFWVIDHSSKIILGMRRLDDQNGTMRNILGTVLTPMVNGELSVPYSSDKPIINMP